MFQKMWFAGFVAVIIISQSFISCAPQKKEQPPIEPIQVEPNDNAMQHWEIFQKQSPESEITWDTQTGYCKILDNFLAEPFGKTNMEKARTFLKEHAILFGMDSSLNDLAFARQDKVEIEDGIGIVYIRFSQFFNDLPIEGTETLFHMTETGVIYRIYNRYYAKPEPVNEQKLNADEAVSIVKKELSIDESEIDHTEELVILPINNAFYFAWKIQLQDFQYYIDASSGQVLDFMETVLFQTTGTGKAFLENQCKNQNPVIVKLPNLYNNKFLDGYNFFISVPKQRAMDNNLDFTYKVDDPRFAQVSVYYHLEKAREYFEKIGFTPKPKLTTVYVNQEDEDLKCNAKYNWGNHSLYFGLSADKGCFNDACPELSHDGNIIFHEFGHLVFSQTAINHVNLKLFWSRSLNEAVADYFSCSYFDNPCMSESSDFDCTTCMRDISVYKNKKTLTKDELEDPHLASLPLSASLWQIRDKIGQSTTDWLVYNTIKGLPLQPDLDSFAKSAMDVLAAKMQKGKWWEALLTSIAVIEVKDEFCAHGINPGTKAKGCP